MKTMNKHLFLLVMLGGILTTMAQEKPTAKSMFEFCSNPLKYKTVEFVPEVLAARTCGFIGNGFVTKQNETEVLETFKNGNGKPTTPEWIASFTKSGDKYMASAEKEEKKKNTATAKDDYEKAAFFYYMARWPHIFSPEAQQAYDKNVIAYKKAHQYEEVKFEEVKIPFEGKTITGHLRTPNPNGKQPLVVICPGIDDWKGEVVEFNKAFLENGFATLIIDLPGTGEGEFHLTAGSYKIFSKAVEYAKDLPQIDGDKIGFYGLSGGGHYAAAMALYDKNIKASVNVGGPVHLSFSKEWLNFTPQSIFMTLARCQGLNPREIGKDNAIDKMGRLSLVEQGLINYKAPTVPLLTINGAKDVLASPDEYKVFDELGVNQDVLIFENDGHVAPAHFDIHIPFSVNWMKKSLGINTRHH